MSSAPDTKPCPYCGEKIKVTAVKCRFCGEFLNKPLPQAVPEEDDYAGEEPAEHAPAGTADQVLTWIVPIRRSFFAIMAGYMGILALLPYAFVLFAIFPGEARRETLRTVMYLGMGLNLLFAFLGIVLGIGGVVIVLQGAKKGLPRCIVGIVGGLLGAIVYPILVINFIGKYVGW
jgi:hypothetical protein